MCAVFGLIDYANHFTARQREKVLKVLSKECESRGTDATGFAFNHRHGMTIYKKPIAAHRMRLHLPQESNIILGHTRMATQGDKKDNFNNHPFSGRTGATGFALAHNGVLHNDFRLQKQYDLPATNIETDSYVAVQLLEQSKALDFAALISMAEKVEGSFVFTVLDDADNMYFVKGDNPLALYHFAHEGFYIYASISSILDSALMRLGLLTGFYTEIPSICGDILKIDPNGKLTTAKFDTSHLHNWDYGYLRNYPFSYRQENIDSLAVNQLKEFASYLCIEPEHIDLLLEYGYTTDDIEDMFYTPGELECAIDEALCGNAYCGGEW